MNTSLILMRHEIQEAARNRWFLLYAAGFLVLTLSLSWVAASGVGNYGVTGFGRTSATLVNLVLLVVPLMGLTLGAQAIAGERERGELAYALSHPVTATEVLAGKFAGMALALLGALVAGFGVSGLVISLQAGSAGILEYSGLIAVTMLLALGSLSVGFLISAALHKSSTALGVALFTWLTFAFLSDLGLMGTAIVTKLDADTLLALTLANPLQAFKLSALLTVQDNLDFMGPAGTYALRRYGDAFVPILIGVLSAWVIIPLALALPLFKWRGPS